MKGLCRIENSIIDKDPSFEEGCDLVEPIVNPVVAASACNENSSGPEGEDVEPD